MVDEKKYALEDALEDMVRAFSAFLRRKHNMAEALEITSLVCLFIAVIIRYG